MLFWCIWPLMTVSPVRGSACWTTGFKKKSMGAKRRKKSNGDHTASEDPWAPRQLPVLGNRQRQSDVGEEAKEKVQAACGRSRMQREVLQSGNCRGKESDRKRKTAAGEDELITAKDDGLHVYVSCDPQRLRESLRVTVHL